MLPARTNKNTHNNTGINKHIVLINIPMHSHPHALLHTLIHIQTHTSIAGMAHAKRIENNHDMVLTYKVTNVVIGEDIEQ